MHFRKEFWVCLLLTVAGSSVAEADNREITLTRRYGVGARAMGMGGAAVALVEDGTALFLNPAGLARVRRIELSGGIKHQSYGLNAQVQFEGDDFVSAPLEGKSVVSRLGSFIGVYPFPTYRGSLVGAVGVDRVFSTDLEMVYRGGNDAGSFSDFESYQVTGGIRAWAVGGALDISPSAALGLTLIIWNGHDDVINRYDCETCDPDTLDFHKAIATDYSAVSAILGFQFYLGPHIRLAASIESPVNFDLEGTFTFNGTPFYYADKLRLPFSYVGGAALSLGALTLAGDVRYTDWRQIEYDGVLRDEGRFEYRSTTDVHLGAEYLIPVYPLRIRAGYYLEPLAYQSANILDDQHFYTVGAGVLIDDVLAVDAAVVLGDLKWWSEEITDRVLLRDETFTRVFVSTAYRF